MTTCRTCNDQQGVVWKEHATDIKVTHTDYKSEFTTTGSNYILQATTRPSRCRVLYSEGVSDPVDEKDDHNYSHNINIMFLHQHSSTQRLPHEFWIENDHLRISNLNSTTLSTSDLLAAPLRQKVGSYKTTTSWPSTSN